MAVSRVSLSSITQGFPKSRSFLDGNSAYNPSSFESIATVTGTGSSGTITFSSIPSTYKSLQIRGLMNTNLGSNASTYMTLNGDTGANYARHYLYGDGTSATAVGSNADSSIQTGWVGNSSTSMGTVIIDIIDYASTSKNKTIRSFSGDDLNGSGRVMLLSGLWVNTAAVSSISLTIGGSFTTTTQFALYGIKGE